MERAQTARASGYYVPPHKQHGGRGPGRAAGRRGAEVLPRRFRRDVDRKQRARHRGTRDTQVDASAAHNVDY